MKKRLKIKEIVKEKYGQIAAGGGSCCCSSSCCNSQSISKSVGYSEKELKSVPQGADLGLGCGNPTALASLKEGEVVLDLGSGAGFDAFLAARKVGKTGKVIGVDMTEEMIARARSNAKKGDFRNVEFKLGEIERLPVETDSIDVIISNCVINLSANKPKVFKEALRVLKPGGRIMVSDLVLSRKLPEKLAKSAEAYVGCIAGASLKKDYLSYIKAAGFRDISIVNESTYPAAGEAMDCVSSIKVSALKPGRS